MKKILIFTGSQNYGAIGAGTVDSAFTPDLLNAGAIGIYGLAGTDSDTAGNNDKEVLIIGSSGTGVAGATKASVFKAGGGDLIRFSQGATTFPIQSQNIQRFGVSRITKKSYVAPTKQVSFIGWNGTTGAMNMATVAQNDEGIILGLQNEASTTDKIREQENYTTGRLDALESVYSSLAKVANNINLWAYKTTSAMVTNNGTSQVDFTGTGTAVKMTKGSTTVAFMIESAAGFVASTGSVTAGDIFSVSHAGMISVTFTANILGTSAGHHNITIAGTQYAVADAGTAAQNATAIAAAINAGTQASAVTSGTSDVTVVMNRTTYAAKVLATYSADDSSWTNLTLTVNTTVGEVIPTVGKASATVSAAASFELDYAWGGETGYYYGGTSRTLTAGILTAGTEYGLKLTTDTVGYVYNWAVQGVFQYATNSSVPVVGSTLGSGAGDHIVFLEEKYVVERGQIDSVDKRMKTLPRFANAASNYDIYTIEFSNSTTASGYINDKSIYSAIMLCIPQTATQTANAAITELETIISAAAALFPNASINF